MFTAYNKESIVGRKVSDNGDWTFGSTMNINFNSHITL
jgi:hypothetical protein